MRPPLRICGNDQTVIVPPTPGEISKERLQEEAKICRMNIRIVEKTGRTVKSLVQRSDPSKKGSCWDPECVVCKTKVNVEKNQWDIEFGVRNVRNLERGTS